VSSYPIIQYESNRRAIRTASIFMDRYKLTRSGEAGEANAFWGLVDGYKKGNRFGMTSNILEVKIVNISIYQ
jgi:hypothetical protein